MKSTISHSLKETEEIAKKWLAEISVGNNSKKAEGSNSGAVVVGLCGSLGSGKTAFTQAVAQALSVNEQVTSPTFVIMKIYEVDSNSGKWPWKRLVHIDAYRLEKAEEVGALDFESIVADPHNLILIEWADNIEKALPEGWKRIDFKTVSESERRINFA